MSEKVKAWAKRYFGSLHLGMYLGMIFLSLALLVVDIVTKHVAYHHFKGQIGIRETGIPYLIDFTLVFNDGAAWNFLSGQKWILVTISALASLVLLYFLLFRADRYNRTTMVGIALMFAGASGNLIDRFGFMIRKGIYKNGVIDFLDFAFLPMFPTCNIADYCLSIGVVVLAIGVLLSVLKQRKYEKKTMENHEEEALKEDDLSDRLSQIEKTKQEKKSSDAKAEEDVKTDETDLHH